MALTNPPLPDKGIGAIHDRAAVGETVQAGKLPHRRPDNMWAGRSDGGDCAICGAPVEPEEMEYELEYARNGSDPGGIDTYHVHIRCFTTRPSKVADLPAVSSARPVGSRITGEAS